MPGLSLSMLVKGARASMQGIGLDMSLCECAILGIFQLNYKRLSNKRWKLCFYLRQRMLWCYQ